MPVTAPPVETAVPRGKERLLDAALKLFGERGFEGASVRDITAEAGVSLGLVRRHFDSKEGLRRALDDRLVEDAQTILEELPVDASPDLLRQLWAAAVLRYGGPERAGMVAAYLRRALLEVSGASEALFARFAEIWQGLYERWKASGELRDDLDETWVLILFMTLALGTPLLAPFLEREYGVDLTDLKTLERRHLVVTEILEHGLLRR
jgi:AcrR family transcriptional regulator